jgi:hypothetical protein
MPPGDPAGSGSDLMAKKDRDIVRSWIKAGAKDN